MGDDEAQTIASMSATVQRLRQGFESGQTRSIEWRKAQLQKLVDMVIKHRDEFTAALAKDLGNPPQLANFLEVGATIQEARHAIANLDKWVQPEKRDVPLSLRPGKAHVVKEPYGVALIVAPWNYPFRLLTFPLIGALAAGNTVLVKPSEVSPNVSAAIRRAFTATFTPDVVAVVEGGVAVSQAILRERFDYIFYTGNTEVGRLVMKAAAEHLTPVTLELGGKSPVYVDKSAKLDVAVNRVLFGKFTNCGQTCVAPDYVLVSRSVKDAFIAKLKERLSEWYGKDASKVNYYSRIITPRHAARLARFIEENRDKVIFGGRAEPEARFVEPTLMFEPSTESALMREEIFGPILPIFVVNDADEAIRVINARPKPLALYVFAEDKGVAQHVIANTSSGGVGINQTIMQVGCGELEFGGVGPSGMGSYNGVHTFNTFSHRRGVFDKATWLDPRKMYPPFDEDQLALFDKIADGISFPVKKVVAAVAAVAIGAVLIKSRL